MINIMPFKEINGGEESIMIMLMKALLFQQK